MYVGGNVLKYWITWMSGYVRIYVRGMRGYRWSYVIRGAVVAVLLWPLVKVGI
jgi:hypothetical protein